MVFVSAGSAAVTEPSCDVSLTLTPSTLMPGETGQLVVVLTNTGSTPLTIYKIAITDSWDVVSVTHPALKTLGSIGVGKSMTLTFPITANEKEGTFYPYPVFVIGSLDSDGLSEFELTFKDAESDSINLVFTYKDENGNTYVQKETAALSTSSSTANSTSGGNPILAGIAVVLLILIVGGAVFLVWKKGNLIPKKEKK